MLFSKRSRSALSRRPIFAIENLEDRSLMSSTIYVVPMPQAVDVTHRHTVTDAMSFAGSGGTVVVEPGAVADIGNVLVTLDNITIKGDPAFSWGSLPRYDVDIGANGVILQNLNLGTVSVSNTSNNLLVGLSRINNFIELGAASGVGHNHLSNDLITNAVDLQGNSGLFQSTDDLIEYNQFVGSAAIMLSLENSNFTTVQHNTFNGDASSQFAIQVRSNSDDVAITDNTIKLTGTGQPLGIYLVNTGGAGNIVGAQVLDNTVSTADNGLGLYVNVFGTGAGFEAQVQGNDFQNNYVGVEIDGTSGATGAGNIDLGGGSNAFGTSKGANDFRGYNGVGGHYALRMFNTDAGITVVAQKNIFDVGINPSLVDQDGSDGGTGIVDASNPLDADHAFVQNLFTKLDGRVGDPTAGGEVEQWIAKLPKLGRKGVAKAILYSDESLDRIIDQTYLRYTGQTALAGDKATWAKLLRGGANLTKLEASVASSPLFLAHTSTDYVQALYLNILGRPATALESTKGYKSLTSLGLKGLAASIAGTKERRNDFVTDLYQTFLHRAPGAQEVTTAAAKSSNLLALELNVLDGDEFYHFG
jgi:hypothetical protein